MAACVAPGRLGGGPRHNWGAGGPVGAAAHDRPGGAAGAQDSDDIRYMAGALKALGVELDERWELGEMTVKGCGGRFPANGGELFLGNAGTAMRPLTAAVAAAGRGK
jgi:5-enolpyruvylshikimate-3-phosphate synthase